MKNLENSLLGTNIIQLNNFKEWLEKRLLTPETIRKKLWVVRYYGERELNTDNIIEFLKANLTKYQPNSLKSIFSSLTSYAKFQKVEIERELITRLIPKVQERFFDTISQNELEQLKNTSFRKWKTNERNNLSLDFMFYTGIRVNELVNIKHCDYHNGHLKVHGKGNKIRFIPIPDFLTKHFNPLSQSYLFQTRHGKKLNPTYIRKTIYYLNKKANLNKHISPHTFRRSFATLLNNKEVRLTTIQKLLGHSDINTTTSYIHNSYQEIYQDYSKLWKTDSTLIQR